MVPGYHDFRKPPHEYMSHETMKKPPWLFRLNVGDEILPSYMGIIRLKNQYKGKYPRAFFVAHMNVDPGKN